MTLIMFQCLEADSQSVSCVQVLGQLDECLEEAGIHRGHVTEVSLCQLHARNLHSHDNNAPTLFTNCSILSHSAAQLICSHSLSQRRIPFVWLF